MMKLYEAMKSWLSKMYVCMLRCHCRMSTQISELLEKGVDTETVAEVFQLEPAVVQEVHRVQAQRTKGFEALGLRF